MKTKIDYFVNVEEISFIHVGGYVKAYIETDSKELLCFIKKYNFEVKIIGATSNILFAFDYKNIILVKYQNHTFKILKKYMEIGSSISLKRLSYFCIANAISGYSKIGDIPGLVGGSIINNASSFGEAITDNLFLLEVINKKGKIEYIQKEDISFSYHRSNLENIIIIKAFFYKINGNKDELVKEQMNAKIQRYLTQPIDKRTLGSTFRRVENINLPFIMDKLNLKELGNEFLRVSKKHVNFLEINSKIHYEKILLLIEEMKDILYNNIGYDFNLEIEVIK